MSFNPVTASERPIQSIHAAQIFHDQAPSIAAACVEASPGELVVAAVSQDHAFGGVWTVDRQELTRLVRDLDDGGWHLVFSPGTPLEDVEERALRMAQSAFSRWRAARVWAGKHRSSENGLS